MKSEKFQVEEEIINSHHGKGIVESIDEYLSVRFDTHPQNIFYFTKEGWFSSNKPDNYYDLRKLSKLEKVLY